MTREAQEGSCPRCGGLGYVILPGVEVAEAKVCSCRSPCPLCNDRGFVIERERGPGPSSMKPCSCRALRRRVTMFNEAEIPSKMHDKTLEDFKDYAGNLATVRLHLMRYRQTYPQPTVQGLLLYGPPGTGKTHLLCSLLRYFTLERGLSAKFVDFFQLLSRFRSAYAEGRPEETILGPLIEVDILAIDELGKGRATEWEVSILDQLISRRYNTGRTVLATTNLDVSSDDAFGTKAQEAAAFGRVQRLIDVVGERIYSRLCEMCQFVEVVGPDYRRVARG